MISIIKSSLLSIIKVPHLLHMCRLLLKHPNISLFRMYFILQWGNFKRKTSFRFWKWLLKVKLKTYCFDWRSTYKFPSDCWQCAQFHFVCSRFAATWWRHPACQNNKKRLRWFWFLTCKYGDKEGSRNTVIVKTFKTTLDQPVLTTKCKKIN